MQAYQFAIVHLHLLSMSMSLATIDKAQGGHKNGQIASFSTLNISHNSRCHNTCSNFHLQSCCTIFFQPHSHVQHSQPAVKLIASTSFQGHTITPSSPALLHEYIEERFPATLFHDWIPKDKSKKKGKIENGEMGREGRKQAQGVSKVYCGENVTLQKISYKTPKYENTITLFTCTCVLSTHTHIQTPLQVSDLSDSVWK